MSKLIRWGIRDAQGWSLVSHSWIACDWPALNDRVVLEAEWYGYRPTSWDLWSKKNILMAEFDTKREVDLAYLKGKIGLPYDWVSAALLGFWRHGKTWLKHMNRSPGKLMCSEITADTLNYSGFNIVENENLETLGPLRLFKKCANHTSEFSIRRAHPEIIKRYF